MLRERQRFLLACATFPPDRRGGGTISSFLYAKGLTEIGHDVRVLRVGEETLDSFPFEVVNLRSVNVYGDYFARHPWPKRLAWHALEIFNPRALFIYRREIRRYRPDAFVTISLENMSPAVWLAAKLERIPVFHLVQSYYLLCWRGSMFKQGQNCPSMCNTCRIATAPRRTLTGLLDGVVAGSGFVLNFHRKQGLFRDVHTAVIPDPIEVDVGAVDRRPREIGVSLRIGYLGGFQRIKGIETLARAASIARTSGIVFRIAGAGNQTYTAELAKLFPADRTRFLGWVSPQVLFADIDVLVIPTLSREAFGRVAIEARAHGVPIIVSRTGGLPETIDEDRTGLSFPPGDAQALAALLTNLRRIRARWLSAVSGVAKGSIGINLV
jgi:glycosyltransferase involved in cell wall biosynthesis